MAVAFQAWTGDVLDFGGNIFTEVFELFCHHKHMLITETEPYLLQSSIRIIPLPSIITNQLSPIVIVLLTPREINFTTISKRSNSSKLY
jgi:hypothetical protein